MVIFVLTMRKPTNFVAIILRHIPRIHALTDQFRSKMNMPIDDDSFLVSLIETHCLDKPESRTY
jgi:hypothetical protein